MSRGEREGDVRRFGGIEGNGVKSCRGLCGWQGQLGKKGT